MIEMIILEYSKRTKENKLDYKIDVPKLVWILLSCMGLSGIASIIISYFDDSIYWYVFFVIVEFISSLILWVYTEYYESKHGKINIKKIAQDCDELKEVLSRFNIKGKNKIMIFKDELREYKLKQENVVLNQIESMRRMMIDLVLPFVLAIMTSLFLGSEHISILDVKFSLVIYALFVFLYLGLKGLVSLIQIRRRQKIKQVERIESALQYIFYLDLI